MQNLPSKPSNSLAFSAAVTQTELVTFKDCVCLSPESQHRVTGAHGVSFSPYISAGSTQQYLHTRHTLLEVSSWRLPKHTMTNFFWKCITFQGRLHTLPSRGNNLELSLVKISIQLGLQNSHNCGDYSKGHTKKWASAHFTFLWTGNGSKFPELISKGTQCYRGGRKSVSFRFYRLTLYKLPLKHLSREKCCRPPCRPQPWSPATHDPALFLRSKQSEKASTAGGRPWTSEGEPLASTSGG